MNRKLQQSLLSKISHFWALKRIDREGTREVGENKNNLIVLITLELIANYKPKMQKKSEMKTGIGKGDSRKSLWMK